MMELVCPSAMPLLVVSKFVGIEEVIRIRIRAIALSRVSFRASDTLLAWQSSCEWFITT